MEMPDYTLLQAASGTNIVVKGKVSPEISTESF